MIILQRGPERDGGTFGKIFNPSMDAFCVSMELPWKNNEHGVSCIPAGEYDLEPFAHPRLGNVFRVLNVPGRDEILIHPANLPEQLRGCIAPGLDYGELELPDEDTGVLIKGNGIVKSRLAMSMIIALNPSKIKIINYSIAEN